jgi:predicted ATP-dependent endonuclease of OLD family
MIKHLKIEGLNERINIDLNFYEDLNILTGKNGSGKTSILKLIWYLVSANIEYLIPDLSFDYMEIETTDFSLSFNITKAKHNDDKRTDQMFDIRWVIGKEAGQKQLKRQEYLRTDFAEQLNRKVILVSQPTIFFPTFRRIEGGIPFHYGYHPKISALRSARDNPLQMAMNELSGRLSVPPHRFVASISTDDIVELLTSQYADVSEKTNLLQGELSEFITRRINERSISKRGSESKQLEIAIGILKDIQEKVEGINSRREVLLRPFGVLAELIRTIFQYKGIKVADVLTLGEAKNAISSDKLSAGEKQMLSFICYNAFAQNSVLIIDEPELSLHADWQRLLFPTLLQQQTSNQFIVATHSPFMYSKFSDKELMLDTDRGGE